MNPIKNQNDLNEPNKSDKLHEPIKLFLTARKILTRVSFNLEP